jgi:hypothetical protein
MTESSLGESGVTVKLKKQLAERIPAAELTHHLNSKASSSRLSIPMTAAAQNPDRAGRRN